MVIIYIATYFGLKSRIDFVLVANNLRLIVELHQFSVEQSGLTRSVFFFGGNFRFHLLVLKG